MTPAYSELVAAVRREGSALLAAAALGLDEEVPACPGWTVADLLRHIGRVYARVATILGTRATAPVDEPPELPQADPLAMVEELLDELVDQLAEVTADTPVWNWSRNAPHLAAFWARRMAHESAVHRFDAQRAHGVAEPVDAELAADGIDELIDVVLPRVLDRDDTELPEAVVVLDAGADGCWPLRLHARGAERLDVTPADATLVAGTASALLLALYGRVPWESLDVTGDPTVLQAWLAAVSF